MKTKVIKKICVIDSNTGKGFEQEFNAKAKALASKNFDIVWNTNVGHCAYFIYDDVETIPENVKEEYILRGEEKIHGDCPYFSPDGKGDIGVCNNPKVKIKTASGKIGRNQSACMKLYEELKEGGIDFED